MNHCTIAAAHHDAPTWSPAWRMECEARYLLTLPSKTERQTALARPLRALRRDALEAEMLRLWRSI